MNDSPPEDFRNMEDILRKILSQAFGQGQIRPGVIGVNIIMAGNLPPGFPFPGGSGPGHDIEHPPIEVIEWDDRVIATCELKGLFDEQINVAISENTLHIIGFDGKTRYRSSAPLPPVVESSCVRTFRNGILELVYLMRSPEESQTVAQTEIMSEEIGSIQEPEHEKTG
ncbi:Hsp20/alpha crystallin family protein [Methanospirillum purgamenti]|jgi:HSP20 family molecular chaperone IbpA|uniref:Hsp20/alpha crystallin family protein n=1 Tax=Methanospirillum hungatei TaxID=2203 RepID=A0A8F5VL70_METHU|nr:Hsp20/alpha crystallin family protein [Methanospirillum hungatei]QXO95072.1 Hsp20/alpha crystallin family protein [Methanospirillum hungatei]